MTTWFPIGLDGRSAINVMDGAYGATGGGTTADTTAISAAIAAMSTLGKKVLVLPSGYTFLTGPLTYNVANSHIVIMPGATLKANSGLASGTKLLDITADNVTVWLFGTVNGNRSAYAAATLISGIHSDGYDRVRVYGGNRQGLVTGFTYRGIYLRDGDDIQVEGVRGTDTGYDTFVIEADSESIKRPKFINCFVDRSAETGTLTDQGCIKIIKATSGRVITRPEIRDCDVIFNTTGVNVAIELYGGGETGAILRGKIINCDTDGPGAGIGQSIDSGTDSSIEGGDAINTVLGKEISGCTRSEIVGGTSHVDGSSNSVGCSIDNSTISGRGNRVRGVHIREAKNGVKITGSGSTTPDACSVADCTIVSAIANANGCYANRAPKITFTGNNVVLTGTVSTTAHGFIGDTDVTDATITGNTFVVPGAATAGVKIDQGDGAVITGNAFDCPSGTGTQPVLILNSSNVSFECNYKGTWTNAFQIVANAESHDRIHCLGVNGTAASVSVLEQSAGTLGDNITTGTLNGPTPYGVTQASFARLKASWTACIWKTGLYAGSPDNTVDGEKGSTLTDITNGEAYILTASGNTSWVKVGTQS